MFRPLDNASLGWCIPWTMRPLDDASLGRCVPRKMWSLVKSSLIDAFRHFWTDWAYPVDSLCKTVVVAAKRISLNTLCKEPHQDQDSSVMDTSSKRRFVRGTVHPRFFVREHTGRGHFITSPKEQLLARKCIQGPCQKLFKEPFYRMPWICKEKDKEWLGYVRRKIKNDLDMWRER